MKKAILIVMLVLAVAMSANAQTRDCRQIVLPHVAYNQAVLDAMPQEKVSWYCRFSANAFFEADTLPTGAAVYDISALTSVQSGNTLSQSFVVDLETLSYYAYNFWDFQGLNPEQTVYFRTPSSRHPYLGVYSVQETFIRTDGGTGTH